MNLNRMTAEPVAVPRTKRRDAIRGLTSFKAGLVAPLAAFPILREDEVRRGSATVTVEMLETAELLMNAVSLRVMAYFVPFLAFERFGGSMDILNRSYKGEPPMEGEAVIPFVDTMTKGAHGAEAVFKTLGAHAAVGAEINTAYIEAYNLIWNFRAKNRSPSITPRALDAATLAPGFWQHRNFEHIVPDFDQAVVDGQVALNFDTSGWQTEFKVQGIAGKKTNVNGTFTPSDYLTAADAEVPGAGWAGPVRSAGDFIIQHENSVNFGGSKMPNIRVNLQGFFNELAEEGISLSLSNIELARKTQAFARIREKYQEWGDDWIIDMLMDGMSIPDQALKNPILLADQTVLFGQAIRYASDAGNLDESATNGAARANITLRLPRVACGGVILLTAEAAPEPLFERQKDVFLHSVDNTAWPEFLRDFLDPEKVEVVTNDYSDTDHATPTATFGYGPMNHAWHRERYMIGGKFYRPAVDGATDTVRQRLWAVENEDPVLSEDWYLMNSVHQKPFLDVEADNFEAVTLAGLEIVGNTQFGGLLVEATGNYDAVMAKAPTERIEKE